MTHVKTYYSFTVWLFSAYGVHVRHRSPPQMMQDVHKLSHVTISNTTLTPLNFRLMTQAPFHIVQMDRIRERPRVILQQTPMSSLEPRQNMLVNILVHVLGVLLKL